MATVIATPMIDDTNRATHRSGSTSRSMMTWKQSFQKWKQSFRRHIGS
jgi:hypothetical protein